MTVSEGLQKVWPNGIPPEAYGTATVLIVAMATQQAASVTVKKPKRPISEKSLAKVREAMMGRRMTISEIAAATPISVRAAYDAVAVLAEKVGKREATTRGRKQDIYALKES